MLTYAIILLFLAMGKALQHTVSIPERLPQRINRFVINVSFPAVILLKIPLLTINTQLLFPIAIPWAGVALTSLLVIALCRWRGWSKDIEINLLILTALGNTGFLGYPMAKAFFDPLMLPYALVYDQLGTFLGLSTFGIVMATIYAGDQRISVSRIFRKIVLFPPFITLMVALFIPPEWITGAITQALELLSLTIIPLTMLSIGMQFQLRIERELRTPIISGLAIKMILLPLFAVVAGHLFAVDEQIRDITIFMAALPPMITAAALLISHDLAPRLAVAILGFGTIISLVTIPIWNLVLS